MSWRKRLTELGARALRTRGLVRAPIALYRAGFGFVFGRRLLMLEHRGRTSGRRRYVVLEVVLRESRDQLVIASGFGDGAQWFQNLLAEPRCGVSTGFRRRMPAVASVIEPAERDRILEEYRRMHPAAWEGLEGVIRTATGEQHPDIPLVRLQLLSPSARWNCTRRARNNYRAEAISPARVGAGRAARSEGDAGTRLKWQVKQSHQAVRTHTVKWFRRTRRRRGKPFDASELPEAAPATVEEATAEGLMLADYASRMRVKNAIIVGVLKGGGSYDAQRYVAPAADALGDLATEFAQAADRLGEQIRTLEQLPGTATHAHDYRQRDASNLRHREQVLRALVSELQDRMADNDRLLELVESARADAWLDISKAVTDVLDRSFFVADDRYERDRAKRMRLVAADLRNLKADLEL